MNELKKKAEVAIGRMMLILLSLFLFNSLFQILGHAKLAYSYTAELSRREEGESLWGGGYISGIDKYWCIEPRSCMHERGYQIDRFDQYSSQPEFRDAVDIINLCSQDYDALVDNQTWVNGSIRLLYELIHSFPGVLGNLTRDIGGKEWGDYSELYAALYVLKLDLGFESATDITGMVKYYAQFCLDEIEGIRNE